VADDGQGRQGVEADVATARGWPVMRLFCSCEGAAGSAVAEQDVVVVAALAAVYV